MVINFWNLLNLVVQVLSCTDKTGVVGYQSQVEVVLAHLSFRLSGPIQSAAQLGNQATPPGRLLG